MCEYCNSYLIIVLVGDLYDMINEKPFHFLSLGDYERRG